MLKRKMVATLTAALAAVFVVSCAEQRDDPSSGFQVESFEAWVKKYDPVAEKKPSGIYMRFIERENNWSELPAPVLGKSWLSINYTGRTLSHNVFETRNSELSRMIGTWVATTHFVPDFVQYAQSQKLCSGLVDAISYMREGDSARIYIPASMGYSSSMKVNDGYSASANYLSFPIYFDIRLDEIVNDPYEWELRMLRLYAIAEGYDPIKDSVEKGLYMKIVKPFPSADSITKDSTVKIWYASYFIDDNQLVMTNVDSIAKKAGYYVSTTKYESKELGPKNFNSATGTYLVYPKVVLKMRKGEVAEALAVSWFGEGMSGNLAAKPQILPYESLRFNIHVVGKKP